MEPIHIKLNFSEAVNSKKYLLSSEMVFLNMLQKSKNYLALRSKEFEKKSRLKALLASVNASIGTIYHELPKTHEVKIERSAEFKFTKEKKTNKKLHEDLEEIKRQLERLNSVN